jgi:hypothetical protein
MTPPTAHLLTIPRELRDQIYSYLTHSFQRTWMSQDQRFSCVIRYENAPLPSLFLAHTRLRDEYLEAVRDKPPSATFIADSPRSILASLLEDNDFKYRGLELLYNATLVVDYRPPYEADFSLQLIPCIVVLGARAPRLRTIQVALARRLATMSHKQLPMVRHIMNHVHTTAGYPSMPANVIHLPLTQKTEAFHIRYNEPDPMRESEDKVHQVKHLAYFIFTNEDVEKYAWNQENALATWKPSKYPQEVLDTCPRESVERVASMPFELRDWKEQRGSDLGTDVWKGTSNDEQEDSE